MKASGIGGQAVLEGIMMKNGDNYAVAVRKPDGQIEIMKDTCKKRSGMIEKIKKYPFIRGVFSFIDSLVLGMSTLTWSSQFQEEQEVVMTEKREKIEMILTIAASIGITIILFMLLPYFITDLLKTWVPSYTLRLVIEGIVRITIFVSYVGIISFMDDIKRVYQYHGAEHKCINCIENGYTLTVENVRKSSKEHKRCGTSFMMFVMIVGIVLLFFVRVESVLMRVIVRIALLPVIAGISYEIIRWAGRSENIIVCMLSKPGLALQKLTTKEPDDDMIEVAIRAVEEVFDWRAFLQDGE